MAESNYYIGLMTGTSLDGIDAAIVQFDDHKHLKLVDTLGLPYPQQLRLDVVRVSRQMENNWHSLATLDQSLAEAYAQAVNALLNQTGIAPTQIAAIGSHGQTIRHCPDCDPPYSIQLGNPHRLSELTGITTVADFRQRDIAAGGQGAPLAPLFHQHYFAQKGRNIVVLNLGGIANISILHADGNVSGHDTGPANTLMDGWIHKQKNHAYDKDGKWAAGGQLNGDLLGRLLAEPWLQLPPPRSTGPELFNLGWLSEKMQGLNLPPADVQTTLCEFTAVTITDAIKQYADPADELILCGGGTYNQFLQERLTQLLPGIELNTSDKYGLPPEWVEAVLFAWLAHRTLRHLPGNVPEVTGASHSVVLGSIYLAG